MLVRALAFISVIFHVSVLILATIAVVQTVARAAGF